MKFLKANLNINQSKIAIAMLVCFFASEAITKIAYKLDFGFHNYSALIKGLFAAAILAYSVITWNSFVKKRASFLIPLGIIFLVGQITFNNLSLGPDFFKNIVFFSRYIFIFILALFFFRTTNKLDNSVFNVYEKIVFINSFFIIIGALFQISLFQTYYYRFGYNGFFMTPSTATYFYALALTYFTYNFVFYKKNLAGLMLTILVCFLVGTKALFLFLFLTGIQVVVIKKLYKYKTLYILIASILALVFLFKEKLSIFFQEKLAILYDLYKEDGLISMLTSMRNQNFQQDFIPIVTEKWGALNFLFGGTNFELYRVEFELLDLFLFFGFIGSAIYLWYYFRKILVFKKLDTYGKYMMALIIFVAVISGNFLNNAPVAAYLLVVLCFLYTQNKNKQNEEV